MTVDRSYVARNDAQRARLNALVAKRSDADLARPMPAGWTVAGAERVAGAAVDPIRPLRRLVGDLDALLLELLMACSLPSLAMM